MTDFVFETKLDTRGMERDFRRSLDSMSRDLNKKLSLGRLDDRAFTLPLGRVTRSVSEFDKSMEAANARVLAFGASTGVVVGLQRAFRGLVRATVEVEKELADINVVLNLNAKTLNQFKSAVFDVANNTGASFKEVAEGAKELSRQGLGTTETLNRLNSALVLSRLSGMGAQESVEALTAAINSYTKSLLTAEEIVNKLATVDAAFAVSSADLAEALKRVGSSAEDASVSFEELIALVTATQQITNRGGTVIGNAYKTIFTRLNRADVLDQLEQLGVKVRNVAGETLPATRILTQYAEVADRLSPALRSNVDEMIGSVFQINQLKAIVKDLNSEYGIYNRALDIANEKTIEATLRNQELNNTLDATLNKTKNNLQNFASDVGNILVSGNLKSVTNIINDVLNADSGSIGNTFAVGFVRGIADFIGGSGLAILGGAAVTIVSNFVKFAKESLESLSKTFATDQKRLALNKEIENVLKNDKDLYAQIATGAISVERAVEKIKNTINNNTAATKEWKFNLDQVALRLKQLGIQGDQYGMMIGRSPQTPVKGVKGYRPNNASSPLEDAIARERLETGLPLSKIKVGQDPRLISPENPTGLGVYNTRDEPFGLAQGIERKILLGEDPRKAGMKKSKFPTFANNTPFMNPIGDLISTEARQGLDNLTASLKQSEIQVSALADATKKFKKDLFTSSGLEKAYNNYYDALERAGYSLEERTQKANEIYTEGENILNKYNAQKGKMTSEEAKLHNQNRSRIVEQHAVRRQSVELAKKQLEDAKQLGLKGGLSGFFGLNALKADSRLKKIGSVEAEFARREVKDNFRSRASNAGLITSLVAPIAGGVLSELVNKFGFQGDTTSRSSRATDAGISGIANIASFAGLGGSVLGPYGALAGAGVGAISTLVNVFSEINNVLPEFRAQLQKTNESMTTINDGLSRLQQLEFDLTKTNDPQKRINIQSQILQTQADLIAKNIQFDASGRATNAQEELRKLNNRRQGEVLFTSAAQFAKNPTDTTAASTLESAFNNFRFEENKTLSELLLDPNRQNSKTFQSVDRVTKEIDGNLRVISGLSRILQSDRQRAGGSFAEYNSNILALQTKNEKLAEDIFKEILPTDVFENIKKSGGDKVFTRLFETIERSTKSAEILRERNDEIAKKFIDTTATLSNLDLGFRKLNDSINSLALLGSAETTRQNATENFFSSVRGSFASLAGFNTSDRSLLDLQTQFEAQAANRTSNNQRTNNFIAQRQEIGQLIQQEFGKIDRNKLEVEGLKGLQKIQTELSSIFNNLNPENFDDIFKQFENKILEISTSTADGTVFAANQQNRDILSNLVDGIRETNDTRKINDDTAEATRKAQLEALRANLQINQKILQIQEDIGFAGGISELISGNTLESIRNSSERALFGNRREQLGGTFELGKTLQSLGLQAPFKDQLISGIAGEIRSVSSVTGLNLSEDRIQEIAKTQFENQFKQDKAINDLTSQIGNFERNFVSNIDNIFKDLRETILDLSKSIAGSFSLRTQRENILDNVLGGNEPLSDEQIKANRSRLKEIEGQITQLYTSLSEKSELQISSVKDSTSGLADSTNELSSSMSAHRRQLGANIDIEKINIKTQDEINKQKLEDIKTKREEVAANRMLSSSMVEINRAARQQLVRYNALSGSEAFKGNLFDSLQANALDFQTNVANFGVELGTEIRSSFKGAISSMVRDIDNFEDAAKQAFISILDKITDFGVSNFVDQGLSLVTNSVKGFNSGGLVTGGSGVKDDVPAVLQGGEYVVRKSVVDRLGKPFFEGINESSGSAVKTLKNAFTVDSRRPKNLTDGRVDVDPNLSAFALTSENNPQNQLRFDTESEFVRYIEALQDYEADFARAMSQYRKQKRNILTQGFMSALFNLGAFGLSKVNSKSAKGSGAGIDPAGELELASGGMSKDTVPALLQGGEYIMTEKSVQKFGKDFFDRLNQGKITPRKFATGGYVQSNNTNFIQPTRDMSFDFSEVKSSIMELTGLLKDKESNNASTPTNQSPVNVSININIDKNGSPTVSENKNDDKNGGNQAQNAKQLGDLMKAVVLETIIKEKRPNGLLSNI